MDDTSRAGIFVGLSELYKGVIVYFNATHDFEAAINVAWDVESFPLAEAAPPEPPPPTPPPADPPSAGTCPRARPCTYYPHGAPPAVLRSATAAPHGPSCGLPA